MNVVAALDAHDLAVDRQLADIASSFRFLLDVSPVNLDEAGARFLAGGAPEFEYRPLDDDPAVMRARLAEVDHASLSDPIVASLIEARLRELRVQIDMLECRNTSDFVALSIELFGAVSPRLLAAAESILATVRPVPPGDCVDAPEFAARVEQELDHYRRADPDFGVHVDIRDDVGSVMVVAGQVLIPTAARIPAERVEALIQHEVGTHALTYVNGSRQPLRVLANGTAGYEATQEGLAVFVEHLVGGLTANRVRTLAARVVAVHAMVEGAGLADTFSMLRDEHGFSGHGAFGVAARVHRGGGLTKDAVYLRGLLDVVEHVGHGGSLEPLWLGKMSLDSLPLVSELRNRGTLTAPDLLPTFFGRPDVDARLSACTADTTVLDLIRRTS